MIAKEDIKPGFQFTWNNERLVYVSKASGRATHLYPKTTGEDFYIIGRDGKTIFTVCNVSDNNAECLPSVKTSAICIISIDDIINNCEVFVEVKRVDVLAESAKIKAEVISTVKDDSCSECKSAKMTEQVLHPSHYAWLKDLCGVEPIDICRHFDFAIGNALKYLMRKGKIDGNKTEKEKRIEDLKKAMFYIQDEIKRLKDGEEVYRD